LEDFENKFPATQGERKKIMQHKIEKKKSCKRERSKKIPTCKPTDALPSVLCPQACKILHF
jgi:hypothetical protein